MAICSSQWHENKTLHFGPGFTVCGQYHLPKTYIHWYCGVCVSVCVWVTTVKNVLSCVWARRSVPFRNSEKEDKNVKGSVSQSAIILGSSKILDNSSSTMVEASRVLFWKEVATRNQTRLWVLWRGRGGQSVTQLHSKVLNVISGSEWRAGRCTRSWERRWRHRGITTCYQPISLITHTRVLEAESSRAKSSRDHQLALSWGYLLGIVFSMKARGHEC